MPIIIQTDWNLISCHPYQMIASFLFFSSPYLHYDISQMQSHKSMNNIPIAAFLWLSVSINTVPSIFVSLFKQSLRHKKNCVCKPQKDCGILSSFRTHFLNPPNRVDFVQFIKNITVIYLHTLWTAIGDVCCLRKFFSTPSTLSFVVRFSCWDLQKKNKLVCVFRYVVFSSRVRSM